MHAARRPSRAADQRPGVDGKLAAARAHLAVGRAERAETICRALARRRDPAPEALHLLGLIERRNGRLDRALRLLEEAAAAAADDAAILCDLGNAFKAAGRIDEALVRHAEVVRLIPASAEALSNLGSTYRALDRLEPAIACLARAVTLRPDDAELHYNHGNALLAAERFDAAAAAFGAALARAPDHGRAHAHLGIALKEMGRIAPAIAHLRIAVARTGDVAEARWNLALSLLLAGDWREGFVAYEMRRALPRFSIRAVDGPAWDGRPLAGRRLYVHAEQGLGDTIQFARYAARLTAEGADVILSVLERLAPLLAELADRPQIATDNERPAYDVEAPLLSLPHLLAETGPFTPTRPYLAADPDRIARWSGRLPDAGLRVGIAWQGNPDHRADRRRSVPLAALAPLADVPGIHLLALQHGPGLGQRAALAWAVERIAAPEPDRDQDGAFLGTAAIIQNLDLVITSDTAIAHLAGALGRRVWLTLAHVPDWRWGLAGTTTPWYPTMRQFRQTTPGDWAGVAADINEALKEIAR